MKRLFLLLFTIICTAVCLAQERFTIGDLTYEVIDSNRVEVDRCSISATAVVIPDSVQLDGKIYTVSRIGNGAFSGSNRLVSAHIPNSVTTVGVGAFWDCRNLQSVVIPDSVTDIGKYAFGWVKNIIYHGTATGSPWSALSINGYIEDGFVYADTTKTILLRYIGDDTTVVISEGVITIDDYAFYLCENIVSISIPNTVTTIGKGTFERCCSLSSINIPEGVVVIEDYLFSNCDKLSFLTIPSRVTSIGKRAFYKCHGLKFIAIPEGVISIGEDAFYRCWSLARVTLPSSVRIIGKGCFDTDYELETITILNTNPPMFADKVFEYIPTTTTLQVPRGSLERYKASDWNKYFEGRIVEIEE